MIYHHACKIKSIESLHSHSRVWLQDSITRSFAKEEPSTPAPDTTPKTLCFSRHHTASYHITLLSFNNTNKTSRAFYRGKIWWFTSPPLFPYRRTLRCLPIFSGFSISVDFGLSDCSLDPARWSQSCFLGVIRRDLVVPNFNRYCIR